MATIRLTNSERDRVSRYLLGGKLPLSTGFLQRLVVDGRQGSETPIVQIHIITKETGPFCAKGTLCDGMHAYTECYFASSLRCQLDDDAIIDKNKRSAKIFPIIQLNTVDLIGSHQLRISDYELICKCEKVPGVPFPIDERERLKMTRAITSRQVFAPISFYGKNEEIRPGSCIETNNNPNGTQRPSSLPNSNSTYFPGERGNVLIGNSPLVAHSPPSWRPQLPATKKTGVAPSPAVRTNVAEVVKPTATPPCAPSPRRAVPAPPPPDRSRSLAQRENPALPSPRARSQSRPRMPGRTRSPPLPQANHRRSRSIAPSPDRQGHQHPRVVSQHMSACPKPKPLWLQTNLPMPTWMRPQAIQPYNVDWNQHLQRAPIPPYQVNSRDPRVGPANNECQKNSGVNPSNVERKKVESIGQSSKATPVLHVRPATRKTITISKVTDKCANWSIHGICTFVDDLISTPNQRQVLNFELTDQEGSVIQLKAWENVATSILKIIQVGKSYYVTNAVVKRVGDNKFNFTQHDYEIKIQNRDEIELSTDVEVSLPAFSLNSVPLNNVVRLEDTVVDILAVADKIEGVVSIINKHGTGSLLREIYLTDETEQVVVLSLWNRKALEFKCEVGQVIGISGTVATKRSNKVCVSRGRRIEIDPPLAETEILLNWYRRKKSLEADLHEEREIRRNCANDAQAGLHVVSLNDITAARSGTRVDILAIIDSKGNAQSRYCNGRTSVMRETQLIDKTGTLVTWVCEITSESSNDSIGTVTAIKNAVVEMHKGKPSIKGGHRVQVVPSLEVQELRQWYRCRANNSAQRCATKRELLDKGECSKVKSTILINSELVQLSELTKHHGQNVDIIAVIHKLNPFVHTNREREVQLMDKTHTIVSWFLSGSEAQRFTFDRGEVVQIRRALVTKSSNGTYAIIGGNFERANLTDSTVNELYTWYEWRVRSGETINISQCQTPSHGNQISNTPLARNIVPLNKIPQHTDKLIDVLAVVDSSVEQITSHGSQQFVVRLIDNTCTIVSLTMGGYKSELFRNAYGRVVLIINSRVKIREGKFSISSGSDVTVSPEKVRGVAILNEWYTRDRQTANTTTI